jgi:tRNA threonylcarbamoyladenosine biosynthesis protein TsaE
MSQLSFTATSEEATGVLARALEALLPSGTIVALSGSLGAGKTRFVQHVAEAGGVDPAIVTSPTFVLCHEYAGRRPIIHIDAYRLAGEAEFRGAGLDEYFGTQGLVMIEWAERVAASLPEQRLDITIQITGPNARTFHIRGRGADLENVIEQLRHVLGRE